jgi:MFS family permease
MRWSISATVTDPGLLFAVQALHGVTVVGLNVGSPLYLDGVTPERLRSTAQGILSMVGAGVAGIASNIASGWLVDRGGADTLYFLCGLGSLLLGAAALWVLPVPEREREKIAAGALPGQVST